MFEQQLDFFWLLKHPVFNSYTKYYRTPCHAIDHQMLHREAEDFPRGGNYPKQVPQPTWFTYLQPT